MRGYDNPNYKEKSMKISSSFLHFEHTPALDEKIQEASSKMNKFFDGEGKIKWSCYLKNNMQYAEVSYHASHCEYHATACTENMYESIDLALSKIEKQAYKQKDKYNKLHRDRIRAC
jgi:putative sigma-54 modulation protein